MKLLLVSDIHANLTAFNTVMTHAEKIYGHDLPVVHLGDIVDYGMRPNETLERLAVLNKRLILNLAGNHERAVLGIDIGRFSSSRGSDACRYTQSILDRVWFDYIRSEMIFGPHELNIAGHRVLFVHGDLTDPFWGKMPVAEMMRNVYQDYDFVICGHTHVPLLHEEFYSNDSPEGAGGKTKTTFINPGSVGQPRNHNPASQYAILDFDTSSIHFNAVAYDISVETELFTGAVDSFYAERLAIGI